MPCNVLYNMTRRMSGSLLLEAAPVQVFDHSGNICFMVVVVTNILCCPSLDYFVFVRLCVGVPYGCSIF